MKSKKNEQKGNEAKPGSRENIEKGNDESSKNVRKNDDHSSGETKGEPTSVETPATPDIPSTPNPSGDPSREYDDTDHEHVHHPPKADNSSHESMRGFVGE